MSFRGLQFLRDWAKRRIYRPRIQGTLQESPSTLAHTLKRDASSAGLEVNDVEEEVGDLKNGVERLLAAGRPDDKP